MLSKEDTCNPRQAFWEDLRKKLKQWKEEGNQLIVMLDTNNDVQSPLVTKKPIGWIPIPAPAPAPSPFLALPSTPSPPPEPKCRPTLVDSTRNPLWNQAKSSIKIKVDNH